MRQANNNQKFIDLRKQHPSFVFESYNVTYLGDALKVVFEFSIDDKIKFQPELIFSIRNNNLPQKLSDIDIRNFVFHIGMIELISYWKATCSPQILIKPHLLEKEQITWWKKLYFNGLGEFFYLNGISTDIHSFVEIKSLSDSKLAVQRFNLPDKVLIPIGGGKDSIVSVELLKKGKREVTPLVLNMNAARERSIRSAGFALKNAIVVSRTIDPKLLELNNLGYLNGHTPFSSVLAFTSILVAVMNGYKHIALSNESSANESTVVDTQVNHQYSKSYEFETDFRNYISSYISPDLNYFSFLRPLNELQIAKLFSKYKSYFQIFRSCNVGSKTDEWCGKCPKCLFTYIILSPFISEEELMQIFSAPLLDDEALIPIFDELIGNAPEKPFECVGTLDDVNGALAMILKNHHSLKLPALLEYYLKTDQAQLYKTVDTDLLLNNLNTFHHLDANFLSLLKSELK